MSLGSVLPDDIQPLGSVGASQEPMARRGRLSRQFAVDAVAAIDLVAVAVAGALPAAIYAQTAAGDLNWQRVVQASLVAGILTVLCLKSGDTFETSRVHDFPLEPRRIAGNVAIGIGATMGLGLPASAGAMDWWIWLAVWFTAAFGLTLVLHASARNVLRRWTQSGRFDSRVAVFGAGPIARRIHDHIAGNDLGVRFAGLWDDRKDQQRIDPMGLAVEGRLSDLVHSARRGQVDQIIIALPQAADGRIADIARRFDDTSASVHIVTHIASDVVGKPKSHNVSNIGHVGLLDVRKLTAAANGWRGLFTTA